MGHASDRTCLCPVVTRKVLAAGLVAATVTTGSVAIAALASADATRTADGSSVGGVPAGALTLEGLRALVTARLASAPASVTVTLGARTATVAVADLGVRVDVDGTAREALASSPRRRRLGLLGAARGKEVRPLLITDQAQLQGAVAKLVATATVPESHGSLSVSAGRVTSTPPRDGQATTTETVTQRLRDYVATLDRPQDLAVPTVPTPAHVTPSAVQRVVDRARARAGRSTLLVSGTRTRSIPGEVLGEHLTIAAVGSGPGHAVALGLDRTAEAELARPAAAALSRPAVEPTVVAPVPEPVLREQGSVTWRPRPVATRLAAGGAAGQRVTATAVRLALAADLAREVPLKRVAVPSEVLAPYSSDAQARKVNSLLGTFTTPFVCCPPRVTNIRLIAKTVDGTLIGPGQTFSLNGIAGQRTKAKGYVEAPFILDGELSKDIGGGVSQFATTTFNAAFFAGLRLDQHQAHSFYISRYPPGREATVNYPSIDLRWTNTTSAPVLVRAATGPNFLTVALYGQNDGRVVDAISGPRRPLAGRDFRITVARVVRIPGRPAQRESFTTSYNRPPANE